MVATKPHKAAKYSYAERVLHAFSQAQRDHRRHSVHIATLRAQVRKLANERNDKLGPRWSAWVGKAIHKLEGQGLLEPQDSTGHVSMTPEGKKAITQARKNLPEDAAFKAIVSQYGTPAKSPRKRAASRRSFAPGDADEDDGEYIPAATPSRRPPGTPASKRRRMTMGAVTPSTGANRDTPSKPVSKMNKTELKAEIRALQRLRLQQSTPSHHSHVATSEAPENTYDGGIGENLTARLREALAVKESQLKRMQNELFMVRATQTPASHVFASSLRDTPDARVPPLPLARFGVTRTQSGSLIPDISMRPTPAPSDHEEDRERESSARAESELTELDDFPEPYVEQDMDEGADFGGETGQMESDDHDGDVFTQRPAAKALPADQQVATPASSTAPEDVVSARLEKAETRVSELMRETNELESVIQERDARISQLTSDIEAQRTRLAAERDAAIQRAEEAQTARVAAERRLDCSAISAADERLSFEEDLHTVRQELEHKTSELEKATEERERLLEKQSTLSKELEAEQARSQELGAEHQKLAQEIASLSSVIKKAEEEKKATEDRALDLSRALEEEKAALERVRAELDLVTGERDTLIADRTALSASIGQVRVELASECDQTEALSKELDTMHDDLATAAADYASRTFELAAEQQTSEARGSELECTRQDLARVLEQLNRKTSALEAATAQLDSAQAQLATTKEELTARDASLVQTSADLEDTMEVLASVRSEIELKATELARTEQDLSDTRASLEVLRTENAALLSERSALQAAAKETAEELSSQAQAHEKTVASLQSDITSLQASRDHLEETMHSQIEVLEAERAKDHAKIENLKEGFVRLRALQMNALQDIEEQIASVSSPNSEHAMSIGSATPRISEATPERSFNARSAETIAGGSFSTLLAGALPWPATA